MQLAYLHTLHHLFEHQTTLDFQQFYHGNRQTFKTPNHHKFIHSQQRNEVQLSSQTNQTKHNEIETNNYEPALYNTAQQQQPNQQQTIQNTLNSLTGTQVLKIYADSQFFKQLVRNHQQYLRQIDQIILRIAYMIGQVLIQLQSNLVQLGYLQDSVILSVKEIQQATYRMVELQLTDRTVEHMDQGVKGLGQAKQKIVGMFEKGDTSTENMLQVYNFMISVWKRPLDISMSLQIQESQQSARPSTTENYMQTDPIILHNSLSIPKALPKTAQNHKIPAVTNIRAVNATGQVNPVPNKSANTYLPPHYDLESNLLVSQVTAFHPKQATPGKKTIQNKIKRAKSRIEAAHKPLHTYNRKIRQKLNNNTLYDQQQQHNNNRAKDIHQQKDIDQPKANDVYLPSLSKPNKGAIKQKTVRDIKLDAVKDKMATLKTLSAQSTILRTNSSGDIGLNQAGTLSNTVMDLCRMDDKIVLDQNRNRIINKQMNGFRPAIINQKNLKLQQNIMKGSFGPNFNNKMMVASQNEKRTIKPTQPNPSGKPTQLNPSVLGKGANVMTSRQNNQQSVGQLRPNVQNAQQISIHDDQIIDLNPFNRPISTITSFNHQTNPNNSDRMINPNVKLQQKLEQPPQPKPIDKLDLPQSILARPTSIQPITIPIIAQDTFISNKHTQNSNQKVDTSDLQKQNLRKMRERWAPEQEKILTQHFVQKGDQFQCSKQLQQLYGSANPRYSPPGVRIKIDAIVRKVHQKFCSLNTKNQNIRKFKQNWQFIRKKSTMAVRRRIYKEIVVIYTAMLNMSQQKRQIISSKVTEINRICQQQMPKSTVTLLNASLAPTNQSSDHQ